MSTFTDFNGPQSCGMPSTKSMLDLVKAYQDVLSALDKHIGQHLTNGDDPHSAKEYVAQQLGPVADTANAASAGTEATKNIIYDDARKDAAYLLKLRETTLAELYDSVHEENNNVVHILTLLYNNIKDLQSGLNDKAASNALDELSDEVETVVTEIGNADTPGSIIARLNALEAKFANFTVDLLNATDITAEVLNANKVNADSVHTEEIMEDLVRVPAKFIGVADGYRWNVVGMLTDKAGTAFIKFIDTALLTANVQFAVRDVNPGATTESDDDRGTIAVALTKRNSTWKGLKFAIIMCTDKDGDTQYYLCVGLSVIDNETSQLSAFDMHVAGVNLVSTVSEAFKEPNSNLQDLIIVTGVAANDNLGSQFIVSNLAFEGDTVPVGIGVRWPGYVANIPKGFLPFDGRTLNTLDYPQLASAWGISLEQETFTLPTEVGTIVKYTMNL